MLHNIYFFNNYIFHSQDKPIAARIKPRPMNRVVSGPPPATVASDGQAAGNGAAPGTAGVTTPTGPAGVPTGNYFFFLFLVIKGDYFGYFVYDKR